MKSIRRVIPLLVLGCILFFAAFLLAFRLSELLMFIGDFGWFYLSARDMLLTGTIPLVGIPSSHPWLHQGPLWTYILALALQISGFHPLSGGVVAILFGLFSVFLLYITVKTMYGERVGLIAAFLYATSPLIIIHARMPYHTAPIPFFTILLIFSFYKWLQGKSYFFPLILFLLVMLYQLELATVIYIGILILCISYGYMKKLPYLMQLKNRKIFFLSFGAVIIPMLPILLYDVHHGFPQTLRFVAWFGYKFLTIFGYPPLHPEIASASYSEVVLFFLNHMQKLLFLPSFIGAVMLFIGSLVYFFYNFWKQYRTSHIDIAHIIIGLFIIVGIGGFFASKTTSEAYLPMIFPQLIIILALLFHAGMRTRYVSIFIFLVLGMIALGNSSILLHQNYLMGIPSDGYGPTFRQRELAVEQILKLAGENKYTIVGVGPGSEFNSYVMSYSYLAWWKGNPPSPKKEDVIVEVFETPTAISIKSQNKK